MPIHVDGVSRPEKERLFRVIFKVSYTNVEFFEYNVSAEDAEDAAALSENFFLDGNVNEDDPEVTKFATEYRDRQLEGIFVEAK